MKGNNFLSDFLNYSNRLCRKIYHNVTCVKVFDLVHGKNDFAKMSKNYLNLKIFLLNYHLFKIIIQGNSSMMSNAAKF